MSTRTVHAREIRRAWYECAAGHRETRDFQTQPPTNQRCSLCGQRMRQTGKLHVQSIHIEIEERR